MVNKSVENHDVRSSSTPLTMVVTAISNSVTIPTNSSMAITSVLVTTTVKPNQHSYNSTGYLIEPDELEYSILAAFSDMQTVFLSCISTLLPLIIAVAVAFGVRHAWRKYIHRRNGMSGLPWYIGVSSREDTAESLHNCQNSIRTVTQPASRILSAHDLANDLNEPRYIHTKEVIGEVALVLDNGELVSSVNHTSKNSNGNIITLTLKNNHLIVETEERTESMEDNSFVVEMEPKYTRGDNSIVTKTIASATGTVTDQQALVHQEKQVDPSTEFGTPKLFGSINTGLSQSDLSISSHGSINHGYRYGNQMEYEAGYFGYLSNAGSITHNDTTPCKPDADFKWAGIENTRDAAGNQINGMENSGSGTNNASNYAKRKNIHDSLNMSIPVEHQEWIHTKNSSDISECKHNQQVDSVASNNIGTMTPEDSIDDFSTYKCGKSMITEAQHKDETQEIPELRKLQPLESSDLSQKKSHDSDCSSLSFGLKDVEVRERKVEESEHVPHERSGSIPPRLSTEGPDIERVMDIGSYLERKMSLPSDSDRKCESAHEEMDPTITTSTTTS